MQTLFTYGMNFISLAVLCFNAGSYVYAMGSDDYAGFSLWNNIKGTVSNSL